MIKAIRQLYNSQFTKEKYAGFLKDINAVHPNAIEFRIAETPVFIPSGFKNQMLSACESIIDVIVDERFKEFTKAAIPEQYTVPNENEYPQFIVFDFGICENENGELEPQLIEMQGFPSLFGFQVLLEEKMSAHFNIPAGFSCYLNGYNKTSYLQLLKEIIVSDCNPEEVILLELFPHQQKTRIDFYCTKDYTGISIVCLTELIQDGKQLFYMKDGIKTPIKRIYNRIIFDELEQQDTATREKGKILFSDVDVEWIPHPNWFYRISKYTLPFLQHHNIPETYFLNEIKQLPAALNQYVLKPLFSFAGKGVIIHPTEEDVMSIKDPENWILQRKVKYADVIETPNGRAKAEVRTFYFWKKGMTRPVAVNNLARLSKGEMIGTRYNVGKEWVGGSLGYFE